MIASEKVVYLKTEDSVSPVIAVVLIVALSVVLVAGVSAVLLGVTSDSVNTSMSFNMTEILLQEGFGWFLGIFPEEKIPEDIKVITVFEQNKKIKLDNVGNDINCLGKRLHVVIDDRQDVTLDIDISNSVENVAHGEGERDYELKILMFEKDTNTWKNDVNGFLTLSDMTFYPGTHIRVDLVDAATGEVFSRSEYTCP